MPRRAHCRTRPFFCPILASSWNQIPTGLPGGRSARWALSVRWKFFVRIDDLATPRRVTRARAYVRKAKLLEQPADMAPVIGNAEALLDDMLEVDAPPAHDTIGGGIGTDLDDSGQFGLLVRRQARGWSAIPGIFQPVRPGDIEPVHPVAQCLPVHAANPGRIGPAHPIKHRRQ